MNLPALPAGLWRVMLATTLVVLSFSLLNPVLAVQLQTAGMNNTAIGTFAMLSFVSVAVLIPVVPTVFNKLGVSLAYRCGLMLELLACMGYMLTDQYAWWCAFAILCGVGSAAAWNATEALVAHNVPASHRGRITGLYQTLLGAGLALGPFLPALLQLTPPQAKMVAICALGLALCLALSGNVSQLRASHDTPHHMGLWQALKFRPSLVWAAVVGGVFEVGLSAISTAHGSQTGLTLAAATSIAGVLGAGSFLLQYPLGWLADHVAARRLFLWASAMLALSGITLGLSDQWPILLWVCAAIWGAIGGALYTLSMIRVAHDFADSSALAGTSAMIAGYTLGGTLGPLISGWMLDHVGITGQATWLTALAVSLWCTHQTTPKQS